MSAEFNKAHENEKTAPLEEAGRLTDAPQHILVPRGVSRTAAPPAPGFGSVPPQKEADKQRMARIERMKQNLKAPDPGREEQREQSL